MATIEHCLYCFEALSASLEGRTPMALSQVESSWASYPKTSSLPVDDEADEPGSGDEDDILAARVDRPTNPALERLSKTTASSSSSLPTTSSSSSSLKISTTNTTPSSSTDSIKTPAATSSPLFVTWNTITPGSDERNLRGCIGTFEPQPLAAGLSDFALTSALHDTRFLPVTRSELPGLSVAVTLLTDFEDADGPMDWEIGVHGIKIAFYARGRRFGSTYLPDVASEQGWTKEETIVSLMRKAGWSGRKDKWTEVDDLKLVRYQGVAESLDFDDYKKWRDWAGKK